MDNNKKPLFSASKLLYDLGHQAGLAQLRDELIAQSQPNFKQSQFKEIINHEFLKFMYLAERPQNSVMDSHYESGSALVFYKTNNNDSMKFSTILDTDDFIITTNFLDEYDFNYALRLSQNRTIIVRIDGQLYITVIKNIIESEKKITIHFNGEERAIEGANIHGVVLGALTKRNVDDFVAKFNNFVENLHEILEYIDNNNKHLKQKKYIQHIVDSHATCA